VILLDRYARIMTVLISRKWMYVAGALLSCVCLFYFGQRAIQLDDKLVDLSNAKLARPLFAVVPFIMAGLASAWAWQVMLLRCGASVRFSLAAGIFFTAQFAKYIPGNIAQHIGRVALAKQYNVPIVPVFASMALEALFGIAVMFLLSMPTIATHSDVLIWLSGLILMIFAACLLNSSRPVLKHKALNVLKERLGGQGLKIQKWAIPIALSLLSTLLSGAGLLLLDPAFTATPSVCLQVVSIFCVAWLAGFVTPGAPAGLGIREVILSQGLEPIIGLEAGTIVALLLRIAATIADLVSFGVGLGLLRYSNIKAQENQCAIGHTKSVAN